MNSGDPSPNIQVDGVAAVEVEVDLVVLLAAHAAVVDHRMFLVAEEVLLPVAPMLLPVRPSAHLLRPALNPSQMSQSTRIPSLDQTRVLILCAVIDASYGNQIRKKLESISNDAYSSHLLTIMSTTHTQRAGFHSHEESLVWQQVS
jgi:hypothetical protein